MVPTSDAIDTTGLDLSKSTMDELLRVDREQWAAEVPEIRAFFEKFGDRLPKEMSKSLDALAQEVATAAV